MNNNTATVFPKSVRKASELVPPGPADPLAELQAAQAEARTIAAYKDAPWRIFTVPGVHEILAAAHLDMPSAALFAHCLAQQNVQASPKSEKADLIWVQSAKTSQEWGQPYGLAGCGAEAFFDKIIFIETKREKELLWALEESLAAKGHYYVAGLLPGQERLYGFTASRRLALRANAAARPCLIVRGPHGQGASAARSRWRVAARPSGPGPFRMRGFDAPGQPRWALSLLRHGCLPPSTWTLDWDETHCFRVAPPSADGQVLSSTRADLAKAG